MHQIICSALRRIKARLSPLDSKVYEYIRTGEYDKAEAELIKVLDFNAESWWRYGTECTHNKQYNKARECYERALELDPNYEKARELLDELTS